MSRLVCQVLDCGADLSRLKEYHQRYRICETHLKASTVEREGEEQRFCQQCGRFHSLLEFDSDKRSCRSRLERHNLRRRKRAERPEDEAEVVDEEQPVPRSTSADKNRYPATTLHPQRQEFASARPPSFPGFSDYPTISHRVQSELHTRRLLQAALDSRARADVFNQSMFAAGVAAESAAHSLGSASRVNEIISPSPRRISPKEEVRPRPQFYDGALPLKTEHLLERTSSGGSVQRPQKIQRSSELESIHSFVPPDMGYSAPRDLQRVLRLSVKLLNRPIQEIPSELREHFASWLAFAPTSLEAFIRPGCVQITADIRCTEAQSDELGRDGYERIHRWIRDRQETCDFWGKDAHMVIQIADGPAMEVAGGVCHFSTPQLPQLKLAQPPIVHSPAQQTVRLQGVGLVSAIQSGAKIHCRGYSGYVECDVVSMTAATASDSSGVSDEILVELPSCAGLSPGLAWLEISEGKHLGNAVPLFVSHSHELATEMLQLLTPHPLIRPESGAKEPPSLPQDLLLGVGFAVGLSCWRRENPAVINFAEVKYLLRIGLACTHQGLKHAAGFVWHALQAWPAHHHVVAKPLGLEATVGSASATTTLTKSPTSCHISPYLEHASEWRLPTAGNIGFSLANSHAFTNAWGVVS